jgi:hypothetical protein
MVEVGDMEMESRRAARLLDAESKAGGGGLRGRTFVLGEDPVKQRLRDDVPVVFGAGRRYYQEHPDITGEQFSPMCAG